MVIASQSDKNRVVEILANSFQENKSVNYIIPQDSLRKDRIEKLMAYSFDVCKQFGEVLLSDDGNGCALVLLPDKKKTTLQSIGWDVKFIFNCIGLGNVKKALDREGKIKKLQPKESLYYLWFIGVDPQYQKAGTGSKLLQEVISRGRAAKRTICLETSTIKNLPWYQKFGFEIYNELDLGYNLFFLKQN